MLREKRQRGYQEGELLDDVAYFLNGARTKVQRMLAQHRSTLPSHVAEDLSDLERAFRHWATLLEEQRQS